MSEGAERDMTVKDIFDLRKQGKIEEAYDAIRPMYAQHKGRYTTLCMFWTAADVFKLRLEQGRTDEAEKIYRALLRLQPRVEDITKELDSNNASSSSSTPPAPDDDDSKLPWEKAPQPTSSAAAFMDYAHRRLLQRQSDAAPQNSCNPCNSCSKEETTYDSVSALSALSARDDGQSGVLSSGPQAVLDCIKAHEGIKVPGISDLTNIPSKSIERHVKELISRHLIEHRGSKKTGGYYTK